MFDGIVQPPGGMGGGMQLPGSMPGGPIFGGASGMGGPLRGAAMGAFGGALRGMTPRIPLDPMTYANAMGGMGGGQVNPQLLAALLAR